MQPIAPATLERLRHLRFAPLYAKPGAGVGERRSDQRGAGLEFIDHRPYRPGDDIRDLDHRLMARLGQPYLRSYAADRQLPVSVVVDGSASMGAARRDVALQLAAMLGFVALAGGEGLRVWRGGVPSPLLSGVQRAPLLLDWLARAGAAARFTDHLNTLARDLPRGGLVLLISDWQDAAALDHLDMLRRAGHEPVVIRLTTAVEVDPTRLGSGVLVLADAETGQELTIALTPEMLAQYQALWDARTQRLAKGWFFDLPEGTDPGDVIAQMRIKGLLA
ncbi:DUF58 domain-containing protein [Ketogulonicigenium vulgare]|uniref:von Willebrand factor, type A n=1 Tax=Ketogulonicigenium vulgare (strain WSH-001) TaxID=759362 RepID=F9Y741_KETVW|nr:DUF58 domain-containing protein [Ketogulonicigenium vulgare]ADO41234.1 conserved hypothetical protein [Ketogulonicigenium vulgare Y25]AEM42231.1 von Willebrand factor, type A [Ketogulonicigenium vulgare WSH-001]ALJ82193.1 hypothetical protein KVH_00780 [Ketogulonicigenium vulgare]ANW32759.1 hypothetical protein KvSKV_00790 [Ketogulonicigenium vulgare]AOZ53064.1 hypothetical protein KVC_0037 [Ketogulonicigenium vulgare]